MYNSYNDRDIDLFNFKHENVDIEDIAIGLANECRFAGQCWPHYSVGQHSIFVMELTPEPYKFQAVMHDAEEAYFKDLPTQLKNHPSMMAYKLAAEEARKVIMVKYGIFPHIHPDVHAADKRALAHELRNFTKRRLRPMDNLIKIDAWEPSYTKMMFLKAFDLLSKGKQWPDVLTPALSI